MLTFALKQLARDWFAKAGCYCRKLVIVSMIAAGNDQQFGADLQVHRALAPDPIVYRSSNTQSVAVWELIHPGIKIRVITDDVRKNKKAVDAPKLLYLQPNSGDLGTRHYSPL